ncbi:hypothetical protein VTN77DRAFT_7216 [Rasamsonia byssochlamydoides]|uniref:uncharacterized protein n=1 Tax=Rasamsonia byssochlamydoides TaxID=89139 RepID=UPI0037433D8D
MSTILGCVPSLMLGRGPIPPGWLRQLSKTGASRNHLFSTRGFSSSRQRRDFQAANDVADAPRAISWLTQTPHSVTPSDIISRYSLLSHSRSAELTVPVIFVTPAFASWIDPTNPLLEKWANPLFGTLHGSQPQKTFYAVAAVVDKIPVPQNRIGHTEKITCDNGSPLPGSEGLSLLLARGSDVRVNVAESTRVRGTASGEPAFIFSTQSLNASLNDEDRGRVSYEVGLRLANTVFVNGKDRTLLGMRWDYDPASERYSLSKCYDLAICSITSPAATACSSLKIPLHQITQRRKVVSSMGNILRQVSKSLDGDVNDAMPASSELEKELPRYVREHGITDQRVSVWALVEPSEASSRTENSTEGHFERLIKGGSTIHRVVSGGGGWGKKQGLLSLDPEVNFRGKAPSKHEIAIDQLFEGPNGSAPPEVLPDIKDILSAGLEQDLTSLSQVAKPGDHIQFFVSSELHSQQAEVPKRQASESALLCKFVVAASSEAPQMTPSSLDPDTEGSSPKDLVLITNYFGALSEKAITYSQAVSNAQSTGNNLECRTKLCVPGSQVELEVR